VKRIFLDTSSLLAYLTDLDKEKADEVEGWLEGAVKDKVRLWTTTLVIVETVEVLELGFGVAREKIKETMLGVLHREGLELDERDVLVQALYSLAETQEAFGTCYHQAIRKA
jgi:predicted nucleic-acid-binding protein